MAETYEQWKNRIAPIVYSQLFSCESFVNLLKSKHPRYLKNSVAKFFNKFNTQIDLIKINDEKCYAIETQYIKNDYYDGHDKIKIITKFVGPVAGYTYSCVYFHFFLPIIEIPKTYSDYCAYRSLYTI